MTPVERCVAALEDLEFAEKAYAHSARLLEHGASVARSQALDSSKAAPISSLEQGTAFYCAANRRVRDAEAKLGAPLGIATDTDTSRPDEDAARAVERHAAVKAALTRLRNA
jgi:hypothetical protein